MEEPCVTSNQVVGPSTLLLYCSKDVDLTHLVPSYLAMHLNEFNKLYSGSMFIGLGVLLFHETG